MDVHHLMHGIPFVWDAAKDAVNVRKHGVSFETACEAFFDPFLRLAEAGEHHEERLAFLGVTKRGRLLFVVYVERDGDLFRLVSARPATLAERREYEDL